MTSQGSGNTHPGAHSSLLQILPGGSGLIAAHPWSGEVVRLELGGSEPRVVARVNAGGEPRSLALSPDGRRVYVALAGASRILVLRTDTLAPRIFFDVDAVPHAVLCSGDGAAILVADFRGDRILRLSAVNGEVEATSDHVDRPAALARSPARGEFYTISFRTGEVVVLDEHCRLIQRLPPPTQLGQCRHLTPGPDGSLYAPQTRADTVVGGRMFDRTVFPTVAVIDAARGRISLDYSPDLLTVPPHRPTEAAIDEETLYLASAGSDDVLAIDRATGLAKWHTRHAGLEPGGLALDPASGRLHLLTITGQSIVTLDAETGAVLDRTRFTNDPTDPNVARGRYLFGTATDNRLTKDQWMSCAVCHPDGDADGLQWDFGEGPLDTRSLRGSLKTTPLHFDGHLDEIQDTYRFTRTVMAGRWFVPRARMNDWLGDSNAGLDPDLDALAVYIASLSPVPSPTPPRQLESILERGRQIFHSERAGCAGCHPPPWYTDSGQRKEDGTFKLHDVGTRDDIVSKDDRKLDTPSLLGLSRSAPYLHDGRASTLEEVFTTFNREDRHGGTSYLTEEELNALVRFLKCLPATPKG